MAQGGEGQGKSFRRPVLVFMLTERESTWTNCPAKSLGGEFTVSTALLVSHLVSTDTFGSLLRFGILTNGTRMWSNDS